MATRVTSASVRYALTTPATISSALDYRSAISNHSGGNTTEESMEVAKKSHDQFP